MGLFKRFFRKQRSGAEAVAPGRVDLLGGPVCHHGGLVIEAALDRKAKVVVEDVEGNGVLFERSGLPSAELDFQPFREALRRRASRSDLTVLLGRAEVSEWALYPSACLLVFCETRVWAFDEGLRISIECDLPGNAGLGGNTAIEIALLHALEEHAGRQFLTTEAARAAWRAETDHLGIGSALAAKLGSAHGRPGALLPVLCRLDDLQPLISLPGGAVVCAIAGDEGDNELRAAAMKFRAATALGKHVFEKSLNRAWHYATDIPVPFFREHEREHLPRRIKGSDCAEELCDAADVKLDVYPDETYDIGPALRFAIEEHARVSAAVALFTELNPHNREDVLREAGALMIQSHQAQTAAGLDSANADRTVEILTRNGPDRGIYGARLAGDTGAGTVVILASRDAVPRIERAFPEKEMIVVG